MRKENTCALLGFVEPTQVNEEFKTTAEVIDASSNKEVPALLKPMKLLGDYDVSAGLEGTPEVTKKYLCMTPGQVCESTDTHIDVDGVMKHKYNSEGKLIHHTEDGIRNFHRWFGNSKAVDEQGRPKVFYHGTNSDFDEFKKNRGTVSTIFGSEDVERHGHFFTPDKDFANEFSSKKKVIPVYLKMHKSFDMRHGISSDMCHTVEQHGMNPKWLLSNHLEDWERFDGDDGDTFVNTLKSSNHDSAIINEPWDKKSAEAHIVFHPSQIKSAIGNSGNFSLESNKIHEEFVDKLNSIIEKNLKESTMDTHINVDGVMKHKYNSEGKLIHHTEDGIRNFHRWFGNSKAVDEQGRPKVFYHGTNSDFDSFDTKKINTGFNRFGPGFYFSDHKSTFDTYGGGENGNVMPVYLKAEKMNKYSSLNTDQINKFYNSLQDKKFENGYDATNDHEILRNTTIDRKDTAMEHLFSNSSVYFSKEDWLRGMKSLNIDSIHRHVLGGNEIVVHSPSQIKSAIGNSGNFSPESNKIHEEFVDKLNSIIEKNLKESTMDTTYTRDEGGKLKSFAEFPTHVDFSEIESRAATPAVINMDFRGNKTNETLMGSNISPPNAATTVEMNQAKERALKRMAEFISSFHGNNQQTHQSKETF